MRLSSLPSLDPFPDMDPLNVPLDTPQNDHGNLTVSNFLDDTRDSDDEEYDNDDENESEGGNIFKMVDDEVVETD